ncbi:hypothetical protein [Pseudomonas nicosulfuronedens]
MSSTDLTCTQWLPGKIEAVDPFPFHGLAYRLKSNVNQLLLDPRDGRPHILMPAAYGSGLYGASEAHELHPYFATVSPALWDIGRPDPETTPEILAAGGKSLGRRLVDISNYHPARLGERTYQIRVISNRVGNTLRLLWSRRPGSGSVEFASFDVTTAFDIDWSTVRKESNGGLASSGIPAPTYSITPQDTSADGTRRLYGVALAGLSGSGGWATVMAGLIEVYLGIDPQTEQITASAAIIRKSGDLLGTYTKEATSSPRELIAVSEGYPSCAERSETRPVLSGDGTAGDNLIRHTRTGLVLGALYGAGYEIKYLTADYVESTVEAATHTRATWQKSKPDSTSSECIPWEPGAQPPEPPTVQHFTSRYRFDLTLRFGEHSVSGWLESNYTRDATRQKAGDPITDTATAIHTASCGYTTTVSGSGGTSWSPILALNNSGFDPGAVYLPRAVWRNSGATLALVSRRTFLSMATFANYSAGDIGEQSECWWHPLLTPSGAVGEVVKYPIQRTGAGTDPEFRYDAAYNPLTGDAVRDCDLPGVRVEGFI